MPKTSSGASSKQLLEHPPRLAIVGSGVMSHILTQAIIGAGLFGPDDILVCGRNSAQLRRFEEELNVRIATNNRQADLADVILLAVKPKDVFKVLHDLSVGDLRPDHLIISIAAGVSLSTMAQQLPLPLPIIRIMTNTPALIKQGMSVICPNLLVQPPQLAIAQQIFSAVGDTLILEEQHMDAVTGLSGSGPAFIFLIVETLIDAGVLQGLPRAVSRRLVLQTILGSSLLIKETNEHPGPLRDMVTSPGGTTIAGLQVMEEYKVRAALLKVVETATQRARELGLVKP